MGCAGCGGSTYGAAQNPPDGADPFYWNGVPATPAEPTPDPKTAEKPPAKKPAAK